MDPRLDLIRHYRWLRRYGLNDSHSGNISVRNGDDYWISPTGACADTLEAEQLIRCRLDKAPAAGASLDAPLHRLIYLKNPSAGAVLHSHGAYSVAATLSGEDFVPLDFEGQYYFPRVPVLDIAYRDYLKSAPAQVSDALSQSPLAVVRGHGVYACATDLNLAYKWTCSLELSAKTCLLARQAGTSEPPHIS
jgi:L-fuculose-phosphate aldolase